MAKAPKTEAPRSEAPKTEPPAPAGAAPTTQGLVRVKLNPGVRGAGPGFDAFDGGAKGREVDLPASVAKGLVEGKAAEYVKA